MRHVLRHVVGWSFLALGLAGLVLPVLQGWLFIAIGAVLLAPDVPLFARLVCWIETRFPAVRTALARIRQRFAHHEPPPC
ncbi:MAG: hypothetical protein ACM3O7_08065 [Acidobacteriota bacterium]